MKIKTRVSVPYTVWHNIELEVDVELEGDETDDDVVALIDDAIQDAELTELPYNNINGVSVPFATTLTLGMDDQRERDLRSHDYEPKVYSQGDEETE